jgi:hypothetical protein
MSRDWSWWDAWKGGNADESKRALDAETDRSLAKDPGRWSWGPTVSEVDAEETRRNRRPPADRRHHTGKGRTEGSQSGERTNWRDEEWEAARRDYQRQNETYERQRREAQRRDEDRRGEGRGLFW